MSDKENFEDWEVKQHSPKMGKQIEDEYGDRKVPSRQRQTNSESDRNDILHRLFAFDEWDERLLSDTLFGKTIETVLTPRERFILEMTVDGKSEGYIVKMLRQRSPQGTFSINSLSAMKSTIKRKLKDGFDTKLPGWIRGRKWKSETEEKEVRDFYDKHPEFLEEE